MLAHHLAGPVRIVLLVAALACQTPTVEARTDRRDYVLVPGDSVGIVRLTVRNRSTQPLYFQTANGQADILVLVRVDSLGNAIVGTDTAKSERWSLLSRWNRGPMPTMDAVRLDRDSVLTSTYSLRRGQYRTLVHFGERPDSLDKHGVWLDRFSIR